jgi:hypothetical protein
MKALFSPFVGRMLVLLRSLGPYAAIELVLPGGTVLALLYWWYRRRMTRTRTRPYVDVRPSIEACQAGRADGRSSEGRPNSRDQSRATSRSCCYAAAA